MKHLFKQSGFGFGAASCRRILGAAFRIRSYDFKLC